jgi:hypothetical protein
MTTTDRELQQITLAMKRYKLEVEVCENRIYQSAKETAVYLRLALMPILHRWGMGMRKGGALVYADPLTHCIREVHTHKAADYALGEVHPELSDALWTPVDIFPYEDTFHDYVEDIPLPLSTLTTKIEYVWIVQDRAVYADTWCNPSVITFTDSYKDNLTPGSARYFGPVTKEYVEDVTAHSLELIDFMYTLPQYIVNGECEWELHTNEVTGW